ncbi:MAG: YdcF family protein [Bryobacteraceae bacterium]
MPRKRRLSRGWIAALGVGLVCLVAALFFQQQIFWELGAMLVNSEPPQKADIAVVLAGDGSGHRILKAAELARQGYVPKVLVSGSQRFFGATESGAAVDFAVDHGYSRDYFIAFQSPSLSTEEEARHLVPELRKLGVHKYLLVTSYFHTGRAGRILHRNGPELELHVVGTAYPHWNDGYWWKDREGRKIWLQEEAKTVADFFRL